MQWHLIAEHWHHFVRSARARWPEADPGELWLLAGNRTRLELTLREAYGFGPDEADHEIARWQESLGAPAPA